MTGIEMTECLSTIVRRSDGRQAFSKLDTAEESVACTAGDSMAAVVGDEVAPTELVWTV